MKRILYVDDVRFPNIWKENLNEVTIARTFDKAIEQLLLHKYDIIDLDHDLGEEKTGYDIVKFMIENNLFAQVIYIHTANPVGRDNMKSLLEKYSNSEILVY